jgi:Protein of unknown function (DUF3306)
MDEPEGFLTRWSRRKREAEHVEPRSAQDVPDDAAEREEAKVAAGEGEPEPGEQRPPEFDISKLPPIESITASTDIRQFLLPGVPAALTRAALRRAWVADPAIRDFVGLSENAWDFNAGAIPGFDPSPPTGDMSRMVAKIFGEDRVGNVAAPDAPKAADETGAASPRAEPAAESEAAPAQNDASEDQAVAASESEKELLEPEVAALQKAEDAAAQTEVPESEAPKPARRGHGRALPS